jgi:hypothetical protein
METGTGVFILRPELPGIGVVFFAEGAEKKRVSGVPRNRFPGMFYRYGMAVPFKHRHGHTGTSPVGLKRLVGLE